MNPEDVDVDVESEVPSDGLTPEDLASIAVDPSQSPPTISFLEESGPAGALVAVAVLVAGAGKMFQGMLQSRHEMRMSKLAERSGIEEAPAEQVDELLQIETWAKESGEMRCVEESAAALVVASVDAESACLCKEHKQEIANLTRRVKTLENWKRRAAKSS